MHCDQVFLLVDQRRFELLTSPVRAVRSRFTETHWDRHSRPFMQMRRPFRSTVTSINSLPFTGVMLGICWERPAPFSVLAGSR